MKNRELIKNLLLALILIAAFVVRLYRIDNPVADWHAWRQADTAAVAKIYQVNGIDLLHPVYFDISNIQSGQDNPQGYRFVELPIYQASAVILSFAIPQLTLEIWLRLVTIVTTVAGIFFLSRLIKKNIGDNEALVAAAVYAFLPFSIYYGRVILPDPNMIAFALAGLYFFDKWIKSDEKKVSIKSIIYFLLAWLTTATALLIKPTAIFFVPVFLAILYQKDKFTFLKNWKVYVFAVLVVIPLGLWRWWIGQYPEGIPASSWLLDGGIRFKGAFFYWIFGERLSKLILGYFGIFLLLLGLLQKQKDKGLLLTYSFVVASLLYVTIFARGNVQHDYYQIFLLPTIALLMARGTTFLLSLQGKLNRIAASVLIFVAFGFTFFLSWYYVRDYFNVNNRIMVEAGLTADSILPKDAKVIAPLDGDTTFLYYINRPGWPAFQASTEELIQKGATHLIELQPSEETRKSLSENYKIVEDRQEFIIVDLR